VKPGLPLVVSLLFAAFPIQARGLEETSCLICHSDADSFEDEEREIVSDFEADVHVEIGLSCHDCHGGNPDVELADDEEAAMDEAYGENPYREAPYPEDIPAFCGRCHSDPTYMRSFGSDLSTNQEGEYWTSAHGAALRQGDTQVATCVDCHAVHGMRRVGDSESLVYPTRVAETCQSCHADPETMSGYERPDGSALPTNQYAAWRASVHADALLRKGDFSSATCNDCHGNHGATPPEVESIAFVCGQCHAREATLFRDSPKHGAFLEHNQLIEDEEEDCVGCHEAPEPAAEIVGMHSLSECVACHGNHAVFRPSIAMLSPLSWTPCAFCHERPAEDRDSLVEPIARRDHYEQVRDELVSTGRAAGLADESLFNWLVDQALQLSTHTVPGDSEEAGAPRLKPEFNRLFEKFRIGKSVIRYADPVDGGDLERRIVRCSHCHAAEPLSGDEPVGLRTADGYLDRQHHLMSLIAQAERTLLAARQGGVDTREAHLEVDRGVNAQIELAVLVHGFEAGPDGAYEQKYQEGIEHARAALAGGERALNELRTRRRGLALSLFLVALVMVAIALKIRDLNRLRQEQGPPGGRAGSWAPK
jgi:hypothetical protein